MKNNWSYIRRVAVNDARKDLRKLLMFVSSIILGIAALVAINSFNYNLIRDIDQQAAGLLGADLVISDNKAINSELLRIADSIPGDKASQLSLFSMSFLPRQEATQFVSLKALRGGFPFYGKLITEPIEAATRFRENPSALVESGMMIQYDLEVGDSIRLGNTSFVISGSLKNSFGGNAMAGTFAPAVYISQDYIEETGLIQPGSLIEYEFYYKTPSSFDANKWREEHRETFRNESVRIQTIDSRKEELKVAFSNLNYFLNLVALVSLILGCIGVASSVLIYIRTKINAIAIFRCLGMKGEEAMSIYFLQIMILGMVGVIKGVILGSLVQMYLPVVFKDFLPYQVNMIFSPRAATEGFVIGMIVTALFVLNPLLSIRKVSPLMTLRVQGETNENAKDPIRWLVNTAIVISVFLFLWRLTGSLRNGLIFTVVIGLGFLTLFLVSRMIIGLIRKFFPTGWSYVFRQGLSNLYRPHNQTTLLLLSIGLGTSILTLLFIIQGLILKNVSSMEAGNQPNVILYGIETNQKDSLADMALSYDLPLIQQVPIITMNIEAWKGKTKQEWLRDSTRTANRWAINREARVTYRDTINADEKLLRGQYTGYVRPGDSIFVSVADTWAEALDVDLGDEIVWNVQGARITTYVGSIREINFRSMQTRFFVLFPRGVLEQAPQFHVLVTKTPDTETTARFRKAAVKAFPNVSVVDLGSILAALNEILKKVTYVIQFMAGFSILTGIIVLLSSLLLSKYQRIRESVLLRTIGATSRQIFMISATEYAILGSLSALTGIIIAIIGSYFIATRQLELAFQLNWWPIIIIFLIVVSVTILIGLWNSRDVITKSPLEILRQEV